MYYSKYYIAESGAILEAAEKFRADFIKWKIDASKFLKEVGATTGQIDFCGRFFSLKFKDGNCPNGFKVPNKHGCQEPYVKNKEWIEKLANSPKQPSAKDYILELLNCPNSVSWKRHDDETHSGMFVVGHPFEPYQICFYSSESPLLIVMPDVKKSIASHIEENPNSIITNGADKWKEPDGLKEILKEEWDLWAAKERQDAAQCFA